MAAPSHYRGPLPVPAEGETLCVECLTCRGRMCSGEFYPWFRARKELGMACLASGHQPVLEAVLVRIDSNPVQA